MSEMLSDIMSWKLLEKGCSKQVQATTYSRKINVEGRIGAHRKGVRGYEHSGVTV